MSEEDAAAAKKAFDALPPNLRQAPSVQPPIGDEGMPRNGENSDNSNTQFATLGLWAARRHDVPMERALTRLTKRFRTSQRPDGAWDYNYPFGPNGDIRPSMIGAGLIGLAVGHGVTADLLTKEEASGEAKQDPAVEKGLAALSQHIGVGPRPPNMNRKGPAPQIGVDYYFLWSVERVGMLYNLQTIGQKEWYPWGADMLLQQQQTDGSWKNGKYFGAPTQTADTCFALLFLRRANLAKDLTGKLQFLIRVKDRDDK
jgi:hypothetical protein